MQTYFEKQFFAGNRRRLRETVQVDGPIIVTANALLQKGADIPFLFQQDSSFWYLTGINEPEVVLVMDKDVEWLLVPRREAIRETFDGAVSQEELAKTSGINQIYESGEGWELLAKKLKAAKQYGTLAPNDAYIDSYTMYANPARAALVARIEAASKDIAQVDVRKELARLRMVKQQPELATIRQAIDITQESITAAVTEKSFDEYLHEYELAAEISYGFRKRGAAGDCFDPITAGGRNAATIHSIANKDPLVPGTLVVIDVGAEYARYCADIARTYCYQGPPTKRQEEVFAAVAEAQDYAYSLLKPGVMMREYEKQVEAFMGGQLRKLGLIQSEEKEDIRKYYPHACSHFLGLDPHDAGDYDLPLQPGVVLTVEPGIYIPEESIGVRIEDDVVVTEDGIEVLSAGLPSRLTA